MNVGETFDAEFTPKTPGEYNLTANPPKAPNVWVQKVIVR
jgi:hypothetical protein